MKRKSSEKFTVCAPERPITPWYKVVSHLLIYELGFWRNRIKPCISPGSSLPAATRDPNTVGRAGRDPRERISSQCPAEQAQGSPGADRPQHTRFHFPCFSFTMARKQCAFSRHLIRILNFGLSPGSNMWYGSLVVLGRGEPGPPSAPWSRGQMPSTHTAILTHTATPVFTFSTDSINSVKYATLYHEKACVR